MSEVELASPPSDPSAVDHALIQAQARALLTDETHPLANAANLSALLFHGLPQVNWVGFYFAEFLAESLAEYGAAELVVGPFQGKPACVRIPWGRGVCGTAAASDQVMRVADVDRFEGHIPCDAASRSEIVIPLHRQGQVIGVLDLDSPVPDRFRAEDEQTLQQIVTMYEQASDLERLVAMMAVAAPS